MHFSTISAVSVQIHFKLYAKITVIPLYYILFTYNHYFFMLVYFEWPSNKNKRILV